MEGIRFQQEPWMKALKQKRILNGLVSICLLTGFPSSTYYVSLMAIGKSDTSHLLGVVISFMIFSVGWILCLYSLNPVVYYVKPSDSKNRSRRSFRRKLSCKYRTKRKAKIDSAAIEVSALEEDSDQFLASSDNIQHEESDGVQTEESAGVGQPTPNSSDVRSLLQEPDSIELISPVNNKDHVEEKQTHDEDRISKKIESGATPVIKSTNPRNKMWEPHSCTEKDWPAYRQTTNLTDVKIRVLVSQPQPHEIVRYYLNYKLLDE